MADIRYRVEWWKKGDERFGGTICDVCGRELDEFPCAVLLTLSGNNPHALCFECRHLKHAIGLLDNEYFETLAFQMGEEPSIPGKSHGGRRVER